MKYISAIIMSSLLALNACSSKDIDSENYPVDAREERRQERGKVTGEEGLRLFGGSDEAGDRGAGGGIGVNSFLWRATLDTIAFMPLATVDPHGGVITTDWYENPEARGERFKLNVLILGTALRADGVKLSAFRQVQEGGGWRDAVADPQVARKLEDKILTRARELRIQSAKR
jgi:hypothetical protein